MIDGPLLARLYKKADAARWSLPVEALREALDAGIDRAFAGVTPSERDLERHLEGLHLCDLALACACARGHEAAWEHFVAEHRPILHRAADALDRTGAARETADCLYADLYGLRGEGEGRGSLFRYFHGRSSLATWLRAVLAQRHVDSLRTASRTSPLDVEEAARIPALQHQPDHLRFAQLAGSALGRAIDRLSVKDRLRLRAYYQEDLTLAEVGRITGEHEATVSRHLAKTRKALRREVEQHLRAEDKLSEAEIQSGWAAVTADAGPLDLAEMFGSDVRRKNQAFERSE